MDRVKERGQFGISEDLIDYYKSCCTIEMPEFLKDVLNEEE